MPDHTMPSKPGVLPPKALLLSILAQLPLVVWMWPLRPSVVEVVLGSIALIAGIALNLRAERLFRRRDVGVRPFSPASQLVQSGPYRFTRNPMYLGMVLICAAVALLSGVILNIGAALVLAVWLEFRFIRREEKFLDSLFGAPFQQYMRQTPRWFGRPKRTT